MTLYLASKNPLTLLLPVVVDDRLSSSGRLDDQSCIGEVAFGSTLSVPALHEQGECSDFRVRLVANRHVVLSVLENIARNLCAPNNDHNRSIPSNSRKNLTVRLTVHGQVNRHAGFTITCILLSEPTKPSHGTVNMLASHITAETLIDGGDIFEEFLVFITGQQEVRSTKRTGNQR